MRLFFANAERRAHGFQELFQLAEQQVVLVAEVKIKGGTADRGAVQHLLHRHLIDGLLNDQSHESTAQPLVRTPDALIGFAPLFSSLSLPACCCKLERSFLDIDRLFVQQLRIALDLAPT